MAQLKVIYKDIDELQEYENNPRVISDKAIEVVANSIKEFGMTNPVLIDKNNIIIAGHTRVRACRKVGVRDIPTIYLEDLSEEQVRAYRLVDNKTGEFTDWDFELLDSELDDILDIDMDDFGFGWDDEDLDTDDDEGSSDNTYTTNLNCPQYEPTGEDVSLDSLVDRTQTNQLIKEIDASDVPSDVKEFLRLGAQRHLKFNYRNIAEYYANADEKVQDLFERSALVIIDYEDALKLGFVEHSKVIDELIESSKDGESDD